MNKQPRFTFKLSAFYTALIFNSALKLSQYTPLASFAANKNNIKTFIKAWVKLAKQTKFQTCQLFLFLLLPCANAQQAIQIKSFAKSSALSAPNTSIVSSPDMPVLVQRSSTESTPNELGVQLILQGEKEQGLKQLELAHQNEPRNPAVLFNLAGLYLAEKNYQKALESIDKALEIDPQDLQFLKRKADVLLPMRNFEQAVAVFNQILQLEPGHGDSYSKLGALYGLLGRWEESENSLLRARNIQGDTPSILNNLASARLMQKKYQAAIEILEVAQQRWPTADREITLGVANEGLGDNIKAVYHYRKAKELGVINKHLDSHIERVSN